MPKWSKERLEFMAGRFDRLLRLTSYPVAVKMFKDAKELAEVKDERGRPVRLVAGLRLAACQPLGQARYWGTIVAAAAENLDMCTLGAWVMGFKELPEGYADGYVRAYFTEEKIARQCVSLIPTFKVGEYSAMLAAPLERMPVDPDVVLFYANTAQAYRFIQAYNYNKGERLEFICTGEAGGCADCIVYPMQTGKLSLALPCNGARLLSWPSDNELVCGVPASLLDEILEGMEFTHAGMVRYPLTWQHLGWEVPTYAPIRNVMDGKGFFPPELRHPEKKSG